MTLVSVVAGRVVVLNAGLPLAYPLFCFLLRYRIAPIPRFVSTFFLTTLLLPMTGIYLRSAVRRRIYRYF